MREGYVERVTKETIIKAYWNLDDIRRSDRKIYIDKKSEKEIILPQPEVIFVINDGPYKILTSEITKEIKNGGLRKQDISTYSRIFGEYFWILHLEHWLDQIARHGQYDFRVYAESKINNINGIKKIDKSGHHLYEDVFIVIGKTLDQALGDRVGIKRFGGYIELPIDHNKYDEKKKAAPLPLGDMLGGKGIGLGSFEGLMSIVTVDLVTRNRLGLNTGVVDKVLEQLLQHLYAFTDNAKITVNGKVIVLDKMIANDHHKAESIFKGLSLGLNNATKIEIPGYKPTTKEVM